MNFHELNEILNKNIDVVNDFIYGKFLIAVLIFVGVVFTIRTRAVQIRFFPEAIRCVMEKSHSGGISSFQALMIATASRVGTGNISGVTSAIVLGGPGAIFWMWVMAVIGSASAFIESTLAQTYKEREGDIFKGGPAYYIQRALGMRWLGVIFAILLILTFAFGFNGLQSYTIASSFKLYFPQFDTWAFTIGNLVIPVIPFIIGTVMAFLSAIIFFGKTALISKVSSIIVPIMAIIYIVAGLIILVMNIGKLGGVLGIVFEQASDFRTIFAGFAGSCMAMGIKRGLFSNEAGMGSAPNAAAAADVSHPVKQALVQVLSVFIDTLVICSTTAFIVLLAGPLGAVDANGEKINGIPFVQMAFQSQFGYGGIIFVTLCIVLFASTSIIGNYFYAEFNMLFISKSNIFMLMFKVLAVVMVFIGAQVDLKTAWNLADMLMGGMATVNCLAMLLLGGIAVKVLKDYEKQKRQGKDPIFKAENVGIHNTDCWK